MTQPPPPYNNNITLHTDVNNKRPRRSRTDRKQPATATSTHLAPSLATPGTAQPLLTPQTPLPEDGSSASTNQQHPVTEPTSRVDEGGTNSYLSLVFRRIRKLKKRLTRVELTEAALSTDPSKRSKLHPEQLLAMENKIEMSAPLKELEDIFKAMTIQQAKDELEQKKRIEEHWQDIQRAQDTAIKETQEIVATTLIQVVRLFYALKQLDEAKECLTSPLLNSLKVLEKFQTRLFEVAQGAELLDGDDCAHSRKELFTMAYMLVEKSTSNVTEDGDITYKLIYDELDRVTHPFTCLELKDIPLFPSTCQEPNILVKAQPRKVGEGGVAFVRSPLLEPSLMVTPKTRATIENCSEKLRISTTNTSSESPKLTRISLCREVASQTDPVASNEPLRSFPTGAPIPSSVVPLVPVHPMPDYRFMLPPWVGGSSYPADLHMRPPPTQQVLSNIHASSETNLPAISQPDGKEDGKGGARRFGHSASGSTHDPTGSRVQHIPQVSHGHSGYARQLEVIYEVEEKDYIGTSNVVTHGRYVPYYPVPIYQEQEQLQAVDSNKSEEHDRVMACTVAESASLGLRLGVPSMSRSQSKQQGFGSSSVTTLHQQESTSSQNNDTTTTITNKESSSKSSNGGGVQARWSGRKKGRSQNRSPQGSTQSADARNLDQRPKESSAQMRSNPQQQQRRSSGNNDQYLLYLQHSLPRPHELNQYNITQNQRQYCRYTSHTSEQPVQQQQRCYNEEQELSHHSMQQHQQRQQDVPHFVQQPCYQYPVDRYFPGHGGGPVYYVQEQQEEHQR